jgi:hypothetical protein
MEAAMRYEMMTLGQQCDPIPVEMRAKPSIDLSVEVAPDSREVDVVAKPFGFDAPKRGEPWRPSNVK